MARTQRDFTSSDLHHVTNRGTDGIDIVGIDDDRYYFEWVLGETTRRTGLIIDAYALMSNHFHLLVDVGECDDPSAAMQWMQSRYASWFNARTERTGPLFGSRFFSKPIDDDAQYLQTARYIHRNPIDIVGARGLVGYRWCSLGPYLGRRTPADWLHLDRLGGMISVDRYLENVLAKQVADLFAHGPIAPLRPVTLDRLEDVVSELDRPSNESRDLLAVLALDLGIAASAEIGDRLEMTAPAVRRRVQHVRAGRSANGTDELRRAVLDKL